jgi:UDP-N-acetylmuramoyl-tripeptide--D-alanyl-D-alanine ligase
MPFNSPYLASLKEHARGKGMCTFSGDPADDSDFRPCHLVNQGIDGWLVDMGRGNLQLPLPGPHLLEDFVAAWAAADYFGLDVDRVQQALAEIAVSQSRLEVHRLKDGSTVLNDAYNAAPDSMQGALEVLGYAQGRRVAVLGDMLELGPIEEEAHTQVGEWVAERGIEVLLAVGQRSRNLAEAARRAKVTVEWASDVESARPLLRRLWQPGDTLLLKASRGMGLDKLMSVFEEVLV